MRNFKTTLLAATIIAGVSSPAMADIRDVLLPNNVSAPVQLNGAGASTVADVTAKVLNCIGSSTKEEFGLNSGTISPILSDDYNPTTSAAPPTGDGLPLICSGNGTGTNNSVYNVAGTEFTGTYISTGSGFGRQQWRNFRDNFAGSATSKIPTTSNFPLAIVPTGVNANGEPSNTLLNFQYGFSEAPASVADVNDYNTDSTTTVAGTPIAPELATVQTVANVNRDVSALAAAGPAIQLPYFVVPIAFAYNGVYGLTPGGLTMTFRNAKPVNTVISGVTIASGGIQMKKATYCAIWDGTITNWNDAAIQADNKATPTSAALPLFDPNTDNATRWAADGAPIRLIGRADRSGGTDVFTRALAAQCRTGTGLGTPTTKYLNAAESLPYNPTSNLDLTGIRADTSYKPSNPYSAALFAGSVNSVGQFAFDRNGVSCDISTPTNAVGGVCVAGFAVANNPGLISVADGSSNVERAVRANTGNALLTVNGYRLDGKFGYIGADFVAPTPGRSLFAASLQVGTGTTFAMPTAANAQTAFGTILPPETKTGGTVSAQTLGVYAKGYPGTGSLTNTDQRCVFKDLNQPGNNPAAATGAAKVCNSTQERVNRANPLHWVNVLYPPAPSFTTASLARPTSGYPITGTANLLTYTCFSTADKANAMAKFIGLPSLIGTAKSATAQLQAINGQKADGTFLNGYTFNGTVASALGIIPGANVGTVSPTWRVAIRETFLRNSPQTPVGFTSDPALGTRNLWIQDGTATNTANPVCAGVTGA